MNHKGFSIRQDAYGRGYRAVRANSAHTAAMFIDCWFTSVAEAVAYIEKGYARDEQSDTMGGCFGSRRGPDFIPRLI